VSATADKRAAPKRPAKPRAKAAAADASTIESLARQVRAWTDSVLGAAGTAADVSLGLAHSILHAPGQRAALAKAGAALRGMREAAGYSIHELTSAIDLKDPALLESVESGRAALPFEIILRLAAVLGRNDPVSFVMKLTRSYYPQLWRALENVGLGRLVVQAGREREFANIYRAHDAARRLSDAEFAEVLRFTSTAFELALSLHAKPKRTAKATGG
jgi:transcriptional regulator with XRE-family HTH domain